MNNALIVSKTQKDIAFLAKALDASCYNPIISSSSCDEALHLISEQKFDLVIINTPLDHSFGKSLVYHVATNEECQAILIVKQEYYDEIAIAYKGFSTLIIPKPINITLLSSMISFIKIMQDKLCRLDEKNNQLTKKIENIQIVDRAKCVLIAYMQISEQEAHRYIEKQAMDMRMSKRKIAEAILKTYED